jgi:hypothetical protein
MTFCGESARVQTDRQIRLPTLRLTNGTIYMDVSKINIGGQKTLGLWKKKILVQGYH